MDFLPWPRQMESAPELPAILINLKDRQDKQELVKKEFEGTGILLERFDAIRERPGWVGCGKSKTAVIQLAKDRGYPWFLLVEDDCVLTEGFKDRFREILKVLWMKRAMWDVFSGGGTFVKGPMQVLSRNPDIALTSGSLTTHFVIIQEKCQDRLLEWNKSLGPHDFFLQTRCTVALPQPYLAVQREGLSDIQQIKRDYSNQFQRGESVIQQLFQQQVEPFQPHTLSVPPVWILGATLFGILTVSTFLVKPHRH